MNCYKCGTEKDLSIKRTLKTGHMLFICKPCRSAAHQEWRAKRVPLAKEDLWQKAENGKEWAAMAKERNKLLSKKYATTNWRTQ